MNREEKSQTIQEIAAQIEGAEAIFAVDYRGISVPQAAELRGKLRETDSSFRVVKNRLTKRAAEQVGEDRLADLLVGPTALTFVRGDTAAAAKAITTFNKEHNVLTYKGGLMGETVLDDSAFKSIALLPSREVLVGQFAGIVASPLTGVVRGLNALIQGLASQLGQIADQGLVTGEASAESTAGPVADEAPSSSQAAGEDTSSAPPAGEAEGADAVDGEAPEAEDSDAPADAGEEDMTSKDSNDQEG
ncbi:MAG TPA: 50S ribosomal protein L10 [Solirubrobacterales bacterium]|jgi:large subunit ribosomal protein L10|nr:50S ribosomal protein L10 [Solirubrobacterales bacterium]